MISFLLLLAANFYVPFENDGPSVDASFMAANTVGTLPGVWTLESNGGTVTNFSTSLMKVITVDGNSYNGSGTRGVEFDLIQDSKLAFEWPSGARTNSVTWGSYFMFDLPASPINTGNRDLVILNTDYSGIAEAAVMQLDGVLGETYYLRVHSPQSGAGANITVSRLTVYWVEMQHINNDRALLWVFNTSGDLVGLSDMPFITGNPNGVRSVQFGNTNPHGDYVAGRVWFDNIVISFGATTVAPVGVPSRITSSAVRANVGNLRKN